MFICYIDESGTSAVPGNSTHFVLAGISVPISKWREADQQITAILVKYDLQDAEIHTAWLLRPYLEQDKIPHFNTLDRAARRRSVDRARAAHLLNLQKGKRDALKQAKKNYKHTDSYIHLTHAERKLVVSEIAACVGRWDFARLFAECIDKLHFDSVRTGRTIDEQALEQVVSRFERFLNNVNVGNQTFGNQTFGLLVHDNNETVAAKHTRLMRRFHDEGTLWTSIHRIIETPLFVDSHLTRMVQVADLCSYALRRFIENNETVLFNSIFLRADRALGKAVGVRHFTNLSCLCVICQAHRAIPQPPAVAVATQVQSV